MHGNPYLIRGHAYYVKSSSILDFLLPYIPLSIEGVSDQVCDSQTYSLSYPNASISWSCTGLIRITSQSNTSCTVTSTGTGEGVLTATITSGSYTRTVQKKLISGGYTSCVVIANNTFDGGNYWCSNRSANTFTIESSYNINSYEVRLLSYPSLNVVRTFSAHRGENNLSYAVSPGWYAFEVRSMGCQAGNWVQAGEVEALDCSSPYSLILSPNPATNVVTLSMEGLNPANPRLKGQANNSSYKVQIWSPAALLKSYTFNQPKVDISVADLPAGRYFVMVFVNGRKLS